MIYNEILKVDHSSENSGFPAIEMENCSRSFCPSMCKNGGGRYQDTQSLQYEIDKTISIDCYYGIFQIENDKLFIF